MFILFYDAVNWSTNSIICTLLCETYSIKEKFNVTLPTFSRYHLLWSVFFTLKTTAASWRSRASLSNMERAADWLLSVHVRSLRTHFPLNDVTGSEFIALRMRKCAQSASVSSQTSSKKKNPSGSIGWSVLCTSRSTSANRTEREKLPWEIVVVRQ